MPKWLIERLFNAEGASGAGDGGQAAGNGAAGNGAAGGGAAGGGAADAGATGTGAASGSRLAAALGGAGQGSAADATGQGGGDQGWKRPDWVPEQFGGKDAEEALKKAVDAWKGYRDKDAQRGPVPKEAAGYTYEPPDALKPYFGKADDPAMKAAQVAAAKHGMTLPQFQGFLSDTFGALAEAGALPKPFDAKSELDGVAKTLNLGSDQAGRAELAKVVTESAAFAEGLAGQLKLGDGAKNILLALADTGEGIVLLNALKGHMGSRGPQVDGRGNNGAVTKEDLQAWSGKPEIDPKSPKFDQRERERYDAAYKRLHGG